MVRSLTPGRRVSRSAAAKVTALNDLAWGWHGTVPRGDGRKELVRHDGSVLGIHTSEF